MSTEPLIFERQGRSRLTIIVLVVLYAVYLWLWIALSIAPFIMALGILITVPALVDLALNPRSGLRLDQNTLAWHHSKRNVSIQRHQIKQMHIHLRMDRSIKLVAELENGKKIRVMQPATPPLRDLEEGFTRLNMPFQKHPFSLI